MQYLKHSTTEVTMTALSDGLDAARSLDRLRRKNTQGYGISWRNLWPTERILTDLQKKLNK